MSSESRFSPDLPVDAALRGTEERLRLMEHVFELAPAFIAVVTGPDHVYRFVNPALSRLVGHRPVLGLPVREAVPEVTQQGFLEILDRVYTTGEPFVANEVRMDLRHTPGGPIEDRYVNFVYQPLRSADGDVYGILATGVDVTDAVVARREVERVLAETQRVAAERDAERRNLVTVLEQAPLAIAITGPSGEILYRNPTFDRLWGRPAHDTTAARYSEVYEGFHLDGRRIESHEWPGARAVLRGEIIEGEVIEIVHSSGRRITVWINSAPVRDGDGRITGGVVMFRDITAERQTERRLNDAQRAQAVGTLAGGVAHEVNNALQAVLGFGSFVQRALGPQHPQARDMRLVLEAAERASRVSQQLLAYTRQQVSQPRRVHLPALVSSLRPVLQQLLGADKTLVTPAPPSPVPAIHADPGHLEQVLINLVANARDATDTAGVVTIEVTTVDGARADTTSFGFTLPAGAHVRLAVSDTGHGMDAATLERMFDPFFTTKPVGQGTGLGLSMVYGIVKQHGGHVAARSAPGQGTTFELYWPALTHDGALLGGEGEPVSPEPNAPPARTVVVADDSPLVRMLVARTLEEEGYRVVEADDGADAMERLEARHVRPDLVVTDVIMPRMNGRQLYDEVTRRWPGVPVLFISGHTGEDAVLQRLVPVGAPFLQKPFSPDALAQKVRELLATARS
jgi:PAS domain S-box-containing protein